MKVLQIINDMGMGGGEHYVLRLAGMLPTDLFEITCTCKNGQAFHENLKAKALRTLLIDLSQKGNPKTAIKIARFVRSQGIDILHAHGAIGSLYGRMVSILTGKPLVTTYHISINKITDIPKYKKLLYAYADRILSSIDKKILAVSKAVKREMTNKLYFCPSKVEVVYAGIDTKKYDLLTKFEARKKLCLNNEGHYIGIIGRLSPEKGIHVLLKAISLLTKELPDTFLIIAGDGPIKEQLIDQALSSGLIDKCQFLGYRTDIPDILTALDVLVLPSLTEGFPLILLEGMASGLPIVSSNVGGIPEIVQNKINGFLVRPNKSRDLAQAIKKVLLDAEISQQFGIAGRKIVENNFSVERMVAEMERIYHSIHQY